MKKILCFLSFLSSFPVLAQEYCLPTRNSPEVLYMDSVVLSSTHLGTTTLLKNKNSFSVAGYADFTNLVPLLGYVNDPFTFKGFIKSTGIANTNFYCTMWVDWNVDGDFTDEGELIGSEGPIPMSPGEITGTIPAYAMPGITTIRVAVAAQELLHSCETGLEMGEVEDYLLSIEEGTVTSLEAAMEASFLTRQSQHTLEIINQNQQVASMYLSSMEGRVIKHATADRQDVRFDLHDVPAGIYLLDISSHGKRLRKKILVSQE